MSAGLMQFLGDEVIDHEPCPDCVRCATCRREWCGYFQFHRDDCPPCVVVLQPPHVIADGKGWD